MAHGEGHESGREKGENEGDLGDVSGHAKMAPSVEWSYGIIDSPVAACDLFSSSEPSFYVTAMAQVGQLIYATLYHH